MSFLKAEWRKLAMANYVIDPEILKKYVPAGTELDLWEGKCYVSLIGFMFKEVKLLGVKIPFHVNFEEVNLRFYVRRFENGIWKRGVVFIKEIVPKPALTFVANTLYNEKYETMPIGHKWEENATNRETTYEWKKQNQWQSFKVVADLEQSPIAENSETEFITEHYWGYAKVSETVTNEYEVTHPKWQQYAVQSAEINVDFGLVYGSEFAFLSDRNPDSVLLAEGSKITVEGKKTLKVKR
ncbi:MAG: DUF2071 domain-containing protein [Spirosomaceae bacterium]|nr:DUF2071 domain-containing protein [Spirosomataceae bacterium]